LPSFGRWNGLWDVGLFVLFGLQHSLMARQTYKHWLQRHVPETLERPSYVLASALALLALVILWQPLGGVIYQLDPPWRELLWTGHGLGLLMLGYAAHAVDAPDLLGFRQLVAMYQDRPIPQPGFTDRGIYRLMRHPLMFATLCVFWITPVLSYDRLLLNAGFTIYILIGIALEERDLLRSFGDQYRRYRRRVGLFWPGLRREAAP
jgi:protein-S-isoprenylcysteine O-methyltransferase Ste14